MRKNKYIKNIKEDGKKEYNDSKWTDAYGKVRVLCDIDNVINNNNRMFNWLIGKYCENNKCNYVPVIEKYDFKEVIKIVKEGKRDKVAEENLFFEVRKKSDEVTYNSGYNWLSAKEQNRLFDLCEFTFITGRHDGMREKTEAFLDENINEYKDLMMGYSGKEKVNFFIKSDYHVLIEDNIDAVVYADKEIRRKNIKNKVVIYVRSEDKTQIPLDCTNTYEVFAPSHLIGVMKQVSDYLNPVHRKQELKKRLGYIKIRDKVTKENMYFIKHGHSSSLLGRIASRFVNAVAIVLTFLCVSVVAFNIAAIVDAVKVYEQRFDAKRFNENFDNALDKAIFMFKNSEYFTVNSFISGIGDKYGEYATLDIMFNRYSDTGKIGIVYTYENEYDSNIGMENLYVDYVIKGSNAEKAGLKEGDMIVEVDGNKISNIEDKIVFNDTKSSEIKIYRKASEDEIESLSDSDKKKVLGNSYIPKTLFVTAGKELPSSVITKVLNKSVGYIIIRSFDKTTYDEIVKATNELKEAGIDRAVIDLRNNAGGDLLNAVKVINLFVEDSDKELFKVHYYKNIPAAEKVKYDNYKVNDKCVTYYSTDEYCGLKDIVILVNRNTASASELVAQTLKEKCDFRVYGEKTFGKGTVLGTGISAFGLYTTSIAEVNTENGYAIEGNGVEIDKEVKDEVNLYKNLFKIDKSTDLQLVEAMKDISED